MVCVGGVCVCWWCVRLLVVCAFVGGVCLLVVFVVGGVFVGDACLLVVCVCWWCFFVGGVCL